MAKAKAVDPPSMKPEYVRVRELLPHLLRATAVVFQEDGQWVIQAREQDQAAHGATKAQAVGAFRLAFAANVLCHARPEVAPTPACPEHVWEDLTTREGAEVWTFGFDRCNGG